jgi:hypothetical protein
LFEVEKMRSQLEQIEQRISARQQVEQEIIGRRVEDLLHPEKGWNVEDRTEPPHEAVRRE